MVRELVDRRQSKQIALHRALEVQVVVDLLRAGGVGHAVEER
jgi:hypothetical protein